VFEVVDMADRVRPRLRRRAATVADPPHQLHRVVPGHRAGDDIL